MKGFEYEVLEKAAEETKAETGIEFEIEVDADDAEITAVGHGAHASTPEDGNNALTGLLVFLKKLPFAPVSYTHLDVYKRQSLLCIQACLSLRIIQIYS